MKSWKERFEQGEVTYFEALDGMLADFQESLKQIEISHYNSPKHRKVAIRRSYTANAWEISDAVTNRLIFGAFDNIDEAIGWLEKTPCPDGAWYIIN